MIKLARGWFIVLVVALSISLFAGFFLNAYLQQILFFVAINVMLAVSLNLVMGFCGQFSLGHAGFLAVGAYASGLMSLRVPLFPDSLSYLNFPIYALIGGLASAAVGLLVGIPSLRLRGDYLAIVTLGFGEIIRVLLLNMEIVGGARGMYGIPGTTDAISCFHAFFWSGTTVLLIWRLVHSSYGRAFLSVREDEIAAECMGINATKTKVLAFVVSSFFAGAAGSLFAHTTNSLNPASFQFVKSVDAVIMVVLGGMGSITGSVIGAVIVTILPEALRTLQGLPAVRDQLGTVDLRMVIYSLTLIMLMIWKPDGLMGSMEWTKFRRRRAARG